MFIENNIKDILSAIPELPGVYFFKGQDGQVIYIGKAKSLKKRILSYFQKQNSDWKISELIKEHNTVEYIITRSEEEALFLEAYLISKFKPKYNVLLKYNNPFYYLLIAEPSSKQSLPILKIVKSKKAKGIYFGPFLYKRKVQSVYDYLLKTLRLQLCSAKLKDGCLNYHLGRCAGNCKEDFDKISYLTRIDLAKSILNQDYQTTENFLQQQISDYNKNFEFEKARNLDKYLHDLSSIFTSIKISFSQNKYKSDIVRAITPIEYKIKEPLRALEDLQILLGLDKKIISIDCFDISHFQSHSMVGSCIRFTYGLPDPDNFRKFKIKTLDQQDDYASLREITARRYKDAKNLPDLILIDGGKAQLNAVRQVLLTELNYAVPIISLAKREETIFSDNYPEGYKLSLLTSVGKLLIALRDYTHHFAISYHRLLRSKKFI